MDNILLMNNSNSNVEFVTTDNVQIHITAKQSCIISNSHYCNLLRSSLIFKDLIQRKIIVSTPLTTNKITCETKQTITTDTTTTNNDTIVLNNDNSETTDSKETTPMDNVVRPKSNLTKKRNRKTRLVEEIDDNKTETKINKE